MLIPIYRILNRHAKVWWYHRELRERGQTAEARRRERDSIKDWVKRLRETLANHGYLYIAPYGTTFQHSDTCRTECDWPDDDMLEMAQVLRIPIVDTRTIPPRSRGETIRLPMIGLDRIDPEPWGELLLRPTGAHLSALQEARRHHLELPAPPAHLPSHPAAGGASPMSLLQHTPPARFCRFMTPRPRYTPSRRTQREAPMLHTYLIDTSVLLHDSQAPLHFQDNTVILSTLSLSELDRFKTESSTRGFHARAVTRLLDSLRTQGRLSEGIALPNGGHLRVVGPPADLAPATPVDKQLLAIAEQLQRVDPSVPTILVTKDINLRIQADVRGIRAEDYRTDRIAPTDLYTGTFELTLSPETFSAFSATRSLALDGCIRRHPNEYCTVHNSANPKQTLLARVDGSTHTLASLRHTERVCGIRPQNREQSFALDALNNPDIALVTLTGPAGTGKTLIAVASGLHQTLCQKEFRRLLVARPPIPVGKDLGFLPGTLEEKLLPWSLPIHDALETLEQTGGNGDYKMDRLLKNGTVHVEALSHIRGRSLANYFFVIDEAQNLSPSEAKTILTRMGPGTKAVLCGDFSKPDILSISEGQIVFNCLISFDNMPT